MKKGISLNEAIKRRAKGLSKRDVASLNEAIKRRAKGLSKNKGISINEAVKKGHVKYLSKKLSINESEINGLKEALENMEEFVDDNIMGSVVGKDYVISVFDKVCIILVNGTEPFLIEREDVEEEEQNLIDDVFETLNLELSDDEEVGYEEGLEVVSDDNIDEDGSNHEEINESKVKKGRRKSK